mmetsp:Transcript_33274/g.43873  ORF Transcript_33274/g.43873 Transcript_33274/m.43873 type:complete len:240 (-) Transcript_33274:260-979(-)
MAVELDTPWGSGVTGFSELIFSLILWIATLAVTSKLLAGPGVKNWKNLFFTTLLISAILIQYYYLFYAVLHFPPYRAAQMLMSVKRKDCLQSRKGGKVSIYDEESVYTRDRCYCEERHTCLDSNGNALEGISWEMCPVDGTCIRNIGGYQSQYRSTRDFENMYERDCDDGRGAECTKQEPCTPCESDRLREFDAPDCGLCWTLNDGDCNFVEGVGPYCWASPDTREVVPCTQCCTEKSC